MYSPFQEKYFDMNKDSLNFREMFVNSPFATGIYSPKTFKLLEVNEAASRLYGCKREEFLKLRVVDDSGDKLVLGKRFNP